MKAALGAALGALGSLGIAAASVLAFPASAAPAAEPLPPAAAEPPAPRASEPRIQHQVTEDDAVRIDELRVRGATQSITVTNKAGALKGSQYQVLPQGADRDPSQNGQAAGQSVWRFFSF
jgi:hypothetical protein